MTTHLDALELRLSNERIRLSEARSQKERSQRKVWIAQIEKEIKSEQEFLQIDSEPMEDSDLLAALGL